ncbi:hypothetical protein KBY96_10860 [Cyanobium sp. ATX 6A2]|uniref:hypothetical protein n=1 Tax=Cyanobium sp. ATX 6A2 TaxID=2823700 RepID=UPI0020CF0D02|nr:hypothetical protein [Cyanobium sp. ATX 6A2]MCP9888423.1 hypothetical protein [Cyanobium sp. ATX 6A2]
MHRPSSSTAPRGRRHKLSAQLRRLALLGGLASLSALAAATAVQAAEPPYPGREQLRELQLLTFNCARDNQRDDCDRARLQADPLLDHPRLSGLCKDAIWTIREDAVVVPRNSFERRDRLDRAGEDLLRFCPPNPPSPARGSGAAGGPPGGPPGAGFRGLPGR